MALEAKNVTIENRYAQQLADDLRENHTAQERLRAQLTELQDQLDGLRRDSQWLKEMRRRVTAPDTTAPDTEPTPTEPAPKASSHPQTTKAPSARATTKKTVPAQRQAAKKAPTKPTSPDTPRKKAGPSLPELLAPLLSTQEPHSVNELLTRLQDKHPERTTSKQLVRNALGSLVARGTATLVRQQNSVFYTATEPGTAPRTPASPAEHTADPAATDTPPVPESAPTA